MNTSSPIPGPMPPEAPAAVAVLPLAQSPVTTAAAAVLSAAMAESEIVTGEGLAEAEREAGILFDAANIEAAVSAAVAQARAEYRAETAYIREQIGVMAGSRRQVAAVMRLCEGRRGDDLLLVASVAVAAETGKTAVDGLPMTLTWDRRPGHATESDTTKAITLQCTSVYGGRADLVITGEDRVALANLLDDRDVSDERLARAWEDAEPVDVGHIDERCRHAQCGTAEDLDPSDPVLHGWMRIQVAGVEGEPCWYCSAYCVSIALADAAEELAIADDHATAGGAE